MTGSRTWWAYTADMVVIGRDRLDVPKVLLIRRSETSEAFPGLLALPGGHVDAGETATQAGVRELAEETGVDVRGWSLIELGTFDAPGRDPRGNVVSRAFLAVVPDGTDLPAAVAADDATDAVWAPLADVAGERLAFDHADILTAGHAAWRKAAGGEHASAG